MRVKISTYAGECRSHPNNKLTRIRIIHKKSKYKIKYGERGADGPQAAHKRRIGGACGAVTAFYALGTEIIARALAKSLPMWYNKG